ncbi:MAG: hypothetical protein ACKPKO_32050, partial [Candidatus Fonsibacter sp.]
AAAKAALRPVNMQAMPRNDWCMREPISNSSLREKLAMAGGKLPLPPLLLPVILIVAQLATG